MDIEAISRTVQMAGGTATTLPNALVACEIAGDKAVDLWSSLRVLTPTTGAYPIIVGNPSEVRAFENACDPSKRASRDSVAVPEWIQDRLQEIADDLGEENPEAVLPRGPWPVQTQPAIDYHCVTSTSGARYRTNVALVLLPALDQTEIPLVIPFGGWNDCPDPEVHSAFFRYWHERYGAELVSLTTDVVEMLVPRPPTNPADSLSLAREQYAYCADIVDQGTQTIDALAAELNGQRRWFFWWD